jgi:succinate dehydrogenase hydrophobic anchor subunit
MYVKNLLVLWLLVCFSVVVVIEYMYVFIYIMWGKQRKIYLKFRVFIKNGFWFLRACIFFLST